jgi:hypothetical protein
MYNTGVKTRIASKLPTTVQNFANIKTTVNGYCDLISTDTYGNNPRYVAATSSAVPQNVVEVR